jgi:LmbE family N-acetylglucosaminyl deacetylase
MSPVSIRPLLVAAAALAFVVVGASVDVARADDRPAVTPLDVAFAPSTRLLVVAPHPDDEALGAAGLIRRVLVAGGQVRVVLMTSGDGFPEGVQLEDRIAHPRARDYRAYGRLREKESLAALGSLGVAADRVTFLGFPDEGLCYLASKYLSAKAAYTSPYTERSSPPPGEQLVPQAKYRGVDARHEIEKILVAYAPTLVAVVAADDDHPDHCATYVFVDEALRAQRGRAGFRAPQVLQYLVHYQQWPLSDDAGTGHRLEPPSTYPSSEKWRSLDLAAEEAEAKQEALLLYRSQMLVIGRFMMGFARGNELFIAAPATVRPECWCDAETVATEVTPPERRPSRRAAAPPHRREPPAR